MQSLAAIAWQRMVTETRDLEPGAETGDLELESATDGVGYGTRDLGLEPAANGVGYGTRDRGPGMGIMGWGLEPAKMRRWVSQGKREAL